jgi:hypothetical protein
MRSCGWFSKTKRPTIWITHIPSHRGLTTKKQVCRSWAAVEKNDLVEPEIDRVRSAAVTKRFFSCTAWAQRFANKVFAVFAHSGFSITSSCCSLSQPRGRLRGALLRDQETGDKCAIGDRRGRGLSLCGLSWPWPEEQVVRLVQCGASILGAMAEMRAGVSLFAMMDSLVVSESGWVWMVRMGLVEGLSVCLLVCSWALVAIGLAVVVEEGGGCGGCGGGGTALTVERRAGPF